MVSPVCSASEGGWAGQDSWLEEAEDVDLSVEASWIPATGLESLKRKKKVCSVIYIYSAKIY